MRRSSPPAATVAVRPEGLQMPLRTARSTGGVSAN